VASGGEVLEDPAHRVGDAVHLRQERFCDECYPHVRNVPGEDGLEVTAAGSAGELWSQDRCAPGAYSGASSTLPNISPNPAKARTGRTALASAAASRGMTKVLIIVRRSRGK
jgi:hypothetical protein